MSTRQKRNSRFGRFVIPVFCCLLTGYFIYHAYQGKRGLFASEELAKQEDALRNELSLLIEKREALTTKVALLRPGTIEKDMLDEQVRYHLNNNRGDEVVIYHQWQLQDF